METRLRAQRLAGGLKLKDVAEAVGTNPANLMRVEKGHQVPKAPLARGLYDFYKGRVPLAAIYDPLFTQERGLDGKYPRKGKRKANGK